MQINESKNIIPYSAFDFLPKRKAERKLLQERARLLAKPREKTDEIIGTSYINFKIGTNQNYGIPFAVAKEVIHCGFITHVPNVPKFVSGILNRQGLLLTIVNLKTFLNIVEPDEKLISNVIVVQGKKLKMGLLVNEIIGSDIFISDKLDKPLTSNERLLTNYIIGLHLGKIALLEIDSIISDIERQIANY